MSTLQRVGFVILRHWCQTLRRRDGFGPPHHSHLVASAIRMARDIRTLCGGVRPGPLAPHHVEERPVARRFSHTCGLKKTRATALGGQAVSVSRAGACREATRLAGRHAEAGEADNADDGSASSRRPKRQARAMSIPCKLLLARALTLICGIDHPATVALKAAAESGAERDIKNASASFLRLKQSDRRQRWRCWT